MPTIDDIVKQRQQAQQQAAAPKNQKSGLDYLLENYTPGYTGHEYKTWGTLSGNYNLTDLTTGKTTRKIQGVGRQLKTDAELARNNRESLGEDLGQAAGGAIQRQVGNYKSYLGTLGLGVAGLLHGDNNYQPKVGSALWRLVEGAEADTGAANQLLADSKAGRGALGRFAMDLTSGAVDLAGDQMLNLVAPGAGMAAMAARSFGGTAEEQREQGKSISTQFFKGLKSAAIEYGTEKFAGIGGRSIEGGGYIDNLLSRAEESIVRKGGNAFLTKLGFAFGSEAVEEMMSDWLNPLADKFLAGVVKGDYDIEDFPSFAEVAYDGLVGGALGLLGGAREGLQAQSRVRSMGGNQGYADFLARKRAKTEAQVKAAKEEKRAQLKAIFDYATHHAEQAMDRAKNIKANQASQTPVEAQQAPTQQVTPEAAETPENTPSREFNSKPEAEADVPFTFGEETTPEVAAPAPEVAPATEEVATDMRQQDDDAERYEDLVRFEQQLKQEAERRKITEVDESPTPDDDAEPREALEEVSRWKTEKPVEDTTDAEKEGKEFSPEETRPSNEWDRIFAEEDRKTAIIKAAKKAESLYDEKLDALHDQAQYSDRDERMLREEFFGKLKELGVLNAYLKGGMHEVEQSVRGISESKPARNRKTTKAKRQKSGAGLLVEQSKASEPAKAEAKAEPAKAGADVLVEQAEAAKPTEAKAEPEPMKSGADLLTEQAEAADERHEKTSPRETKRSFEPYTPRDENPYVKDVSDESKLSDAEKGILQDAKRRIDRIDKGFRHFTKAHGIDAGWESGSFFFDDAYERGRLRKIGAWIDGERDGHAWFDIDNAESWIKEEKLKRLDAVANFRGNFNDRNTGFYLLNDVARSLAQQRLLEAEIAEEKERRAYHSAKESKSGAAFLVNQSKASEPVKAKAEPAKAGADLLAEQAKAKPKTKREPKSNDAASMGDSVTVHEKGGKKSAKTVFDSTKVKGSKWAFDGKARGDEVTVNGKTYIVDQIDSGSAADVLAEAYEESTHKKVKATEYRKDQKAKAEKREADAKAKAERESKKNVEEKTRDRAAKILGKTFGKKYETLLRTFDTKQQNQFAGRDARAPKDVRISLKGDVLEHNTKRGDNATASVTNSAFKAKLKEVFGDKPVVIAGQTVNTFAENKIDYKSDEWYWLKTDSARRAFNKEGGTQTGREFVVNSLSVDGKALTGAEYYKALEKLGLKARSRIDVSQPRFRSANPEIYEERRGYISDRNIDINERLRYAQEMDELDFVEDVNNYIEAYFREERENGEFTGDPDAFEKQLKAHIEKYKDDHDFSWVVDGEELVRRDNKRNYTYALENDTYLDELTKEYEDVTDFSEALDSHIMRRPSYSLTKEYMVKEIKSVLEDESKLETYGEEGEQFRSGTFTLMLHKVNSPYGVTITHGMGKKPTYTIEVFHNKAKVEDGTRVRLLRQSSKSTSSLAEDVAEAIYKYEHGEAYAQESVMDMTRKQVAEELTKQVPEGELSKKRNDRDYSGEYTVGEFSAKVEKDYTDYWGEKVFKGFHADFFRNGAKVGEADYEPYKGKNPDVVQKLATDFHNLNYREGEQHMFDLLKSESKEFATLQGYSKDQRELDKSRARLYNDLDLRTFDSQFEPKVVEYGGKIYEVINAYDGNTPQYVVYEVDEKQNRVNNLEAEINLKNASTPEKAAEYAVKHKKFVDNTSDESMKSAQKYLAQKKAKKAAERKAQNESKAEEKQSEPAAGAGGAEAEAGAGGRPDGQVAGAETSRSDDRESNGRPRLRRLLDLRSKGRVAQGYEESRAKDVADNITFGRSKVRFIDPGNEMVRELGLTVPVEEIVGKGENERKRLSGEILIPANLPDGDIARRGVAGHEGTHAEFVNKYGADAGKMQVAAWRAFQSSHPAEAQIMERFVLSKKSYFGEYAGKSFDDMPVKLQETAAKELFAHWAGGTVRTRTAEGAERATKYQLMLQDFLVKEQGFRPNAFKRTTFKVKGVDHSNGPITIAEWFSIRDEIAKYSQAISAALGGNVAQDEVIDALDVSDADERPESPKYSDVEETLNQASKENEESLKRESLDDMAKRIKSSDNKFYGERKANITKAAEAISKNIGKDASTVLPEDLADFVGKDFSQASKDIDGFAKEFLTALATEDDGVALKTLADDLPKRIKKSRALKELLGDAETGNVAKMARVLAEAEDAKTAKNAASDLAEMIAKEAEEMPKRLKTLEQWDKNLSKRGAIARFLSGDKTVSQIASVYFGYQRDMINVLQGLDNFDKYGKGYGYELAKKILDANFKSQTALGNSIDHVLTAQAEFEKSGGANKTVELKMLKKNQWESHQISLAEAVDFLHTIRTLQASKVNAWQDITYRIGDQKLTISSQENFNRIMDALTQAVRNDKAANAYYQSFTEGYAMFKDSSKEAIRDASGRTVDMFEDGTYYPISSAPNGKASAEHDYDFGLDSTRYMQRRVSESGGVIQVFDPAVRFNSYAHTAANLVARAATGADVERLNRGGLGKSITSIVEERYGKGATDTVKQYIKDSSNFRQESDTASSLLRNLRLNIQGGALFGNFGSMLKQYPSVYNAAGVLDFDSITHGIISQMKAGNRSRAAALGSIKTRHQGNLDPSVAETLNENSGFKKAMEKLKILKFAKEGFEIVDSAAIRTIYLASEYQVEVKDNISRDSAEFNDRVMDYFIPAFLQTQPQFEKTLRPFVQTSDSELIRMFGMFKTQPLRNLNTMIRTISEYNTVKEKYGTDSKEFKETEKQLRHTVAGQASASLMFGALGVLAKLLYHRRKDLEGKDGNLDASKVMSRILMNAAEASGGMLVFGDAAVQMVIDMASGGKTNEFYGLSAGAVSSVADALDAITTFAEKPNAYNAKRAAGYISTLFGIPLNNAYAILNSAIMYGKDISDSNEDNYDDILKYLDAQAKAAKKEEEKAAKAAAKEAEKSGADMLADTAKQNASQSELNSQEEQKTTEVSTYLKKPYQALLDSGMSSEKSQDLLAFIDTDDNNSIKQAEMFAFYKDNPDYEQYVMAMWNAYGYKTSWESYKAKHK